MNILITGGFGFIGVNLIPVLQKEGHKIIVLDRHAAPNDVNILEKIHSYLLNVNDEHCEEVFANNSIDCVVHLGETHLIDDSFESKRMEADNALGLTKILFLANQYGIDKFIYLSSLAVYGDVSNRLVHESSECLPKTFFGKRKLAQEHLCMQWSEDHDMKIRILRVGHIFGPHQEPESFKRIVSAVGFVEEDFTYILDLTHAINEVINYSISNIINIASYLVNKDDYGIDTKLAQTELYWQPKRTIAENIVSTESWFSGQGSDDVLVKTKGRVTRFIKMRVIQWLLPFVENIATFSLFVLLNQFMQQRGINTAVDLLLIYIIAMGIVYGLKQSSLASLLSVFYYIFSAKSIGETFLTATYNIESLLHISVYVFVGTVIGYMSDSRRIEVDEKNRELKESKDKLEFIYDMYDESKKERSRLHDQILSSEDSFGKIYSIISRLEALEPDNIYNSAVRVIEEILNVKCVYIYFLTKNQYYLRLISKSKTSLDENMKSINVETHPVVKNVISNKEIYINRTMDKSLPMVILPIGNAEQIFSVIYIKNIPFEELNMYKVNLIKVVSSLITAAIERAYRYENAIEDERYIEDTSIMKSVFFIPLVLEKHEEVQTHKNPITVLKIISYENKTVSELSEYLDNQLRDFDYIGQNESGVYFVLLSNTSMSEASFVVDRFGKAEIITEIIKEEALYANFTITSHH